MEGEPGCQPTGCVVASALDQYTATDHGQGERYCSCALVFQLASTNEFCACEHFFCMSHCEFLTQAMPFFKGHPGFTVFNFTLRALILQCLTALILNTSSAHCSEASYRSQPRGHHSKYKLWHIWYQGKLQAIQFCWQAMYK